MWTRHYLSTLRAGTIEARVHFQEQKVHALEGCASGCCIANGVPALAGLTAAVRPARTPGNPSALLLALPGLPKCSALCAGADAAALPPRLARAL